MLLGPILGFKASSSAGAIGGSMLIYATVVGGIDAMRTDRRPEALDQYLRF